MSTCRKCGQEIKFRYIDGVCIPIHLNGYCEGRSPYSDDAIRKAVHARCPRCGQMAYFLRHNGGTVWMDELGAPWPKHKCSDWVPQRKVNTDAAAKPKAVLKPVVARTDLRQCPFCPSMVRLDRYENHLKKMHKNDSTPQPTQAVISKSSPPILGSAIPTAASPHVEAVKSVQEEPADQSQSTTELDKQGRRYRDNRTAMVKSIKCDGHIAKVHKDRKTSHAKAQGQKLLTVHGLNGSKATLSVDDITNLPQHTLKGLDHGAPVVLQGVLLSDVLSKVAMPIGNRFRITAYVLAEGRGGNRAVFSWAEVDPIFMECKVYVIIRRDNQPLIKHAGPLQLLVLGDRRSTRWLRQLTAVKVKQAN